MVPMIKIFPSGPIATNTYLLTSPQTRKCVIIDPAEGSLASLANEIKRQKAEPVAIWLTHSHWDHIADAKKTKEHFSIPLFVHPADRKNVEEPGSDAVPSFIEVEATKVDGEFSEEKQLELDGLFFKVIHTPGHSPGSVCFYCPEHSILISGDTLFQGSIGILNIPGGDPDAMWGSLEKLSELPPETEVYPGHGPATTIGEEQWLPRAKEIFA